MDITAVKGAVFGVGDEQVIKIMNGIQSILLNVSYFCKIPHFPCKSTGNGTNFIKKVKLFIKAANKNIAYLFETKTFAPILKWYNFKQKALFFLKNG